MNEHPFYKPLWRRIAIVVITGAWAVFDAVYTQSPMWAGLWAILCAYSVWNFIIKFPKEPAE